MDLVENDINALMKIPIKKLKPNLINKEHIATKELKTRNTSLWPLLIKLALWSLWTQIPTYQSR